MCAAGLGFATVIWAVDAVATSAACIVAVSFVALTRTVARADPFQRTTELAVKPLPFTCSVNLDCPAPW